MLPIPFGNPNTYAGHSGVDYPVPRGSVIRASGPGTVVTRARNDAGGFYVFVKYDALPYPVGYHHMDSHNGVPAVGTRVQEGSQLGFVGSLGARSTGPHLHSEVSGHRTTAGYWQFFDRNRVVGSGSGSSSGGGSPTLTPPTTATPTSWEDDMPTFITSDGGQSLEIGGYIIPLANAEEVGSIQITPGKLVCSKVVHGRIHAIMGGRKSEDVIVNVLGGDGTRYVWAGGILTPIAFQQTVDQLIAMGAGAVDWPLAEVERILAKQG